MGHTGRMVPSSWGVKGRGEILRRSGCRKIRPGLDTRRLADCLALNGLPLSLAYIAPGYRASASLGERIPRQVMMQSLACAWYFANCRLPSSRLYARVLL